MSGFNDDSDIEGLSVHDILKNATPEEARQFYSGVKALLNQVQASRRDEQYQSEQGEAERYFQSLISRHQQTPESLGEARRLTREKYPHWRSGMLVDESIQRNLRMGESASNGGVKGDLREDYLRKVQEAQRRGNSSDVFEIRRKYRAKGLDI